MTNTHLDNVAKNMFPRWQKTSNYPLKLFYLSGTVEDMPTRMNVSGYVYVYRQSVYTTCMSHDDN